MQRLHGISNGIMRCLLCIGVWLLHARHKHMFTRLLQKVVVKWLLHSKFMGKLTSFITLQDWLQLKHFLSPAAFDGLHNDIKIFNVPCSYRKLLTK